MQRSLCLAASLVLFLGLFSAQPAGAQPVNDMFANRTTITLAAPTVTGSNVGATKEAGEPNPVGNSGGKSVWWSWVAPVTGPVKINTIGSPFDTILGVYTGNAVNNLSLVGQDDDSGGNHDSLVSFTAVAGTEYQIEVDGFNGASGNIVLTVDALPAILGPTAATGTVAIAFSLPLTTDNNPTGFKALGLPAPLTIDSVTGTISGLPNTPGIFPVSLIASNVFGYAYTNLNLVIDTAPVITSTNFAYGRVGVAFTLTPSAVNSPTGWGYTGAMPPGLTQDPLSGTLTGTPTDNGVYSLSLVASNASTWRSASLTLDIRPVNDDYAFALPMTDDSVVTGSNLGATRETGEPVFVSSADPGSIWWYWTAPASGMVQVNTIGTPLDTILGVFTNLPGANAVSNLGLLAADDDSGGNRDSLINFYAVAGTNYYFCVNGYHGTDFGVFTLRLLTIPFVTSSLTDSGTLGYPFNYALTAGNAPFGFGASGLPNGLAIDPTTGLISGIPATTGTFSVTLFATNNFGVGSNTLSLYLDAAPVVTSSNLVVGQVGTPFSFAPTALNSPIGWGAVGLPPGLGIDGATGAITGLPQTNSYYQVTLSVTNALTSCSTNLTLQIRPVNDDFIAALPIGNTNQVTGSNVAATREPGEPVFISSASRSVWWSWVAPATGIARVDTIGSPFDTTLGLFTNGPGSISITNLVLLASDDDSGGNGDSLISFNASAGTTYYFCVNGYHDTSVGQIVLNVGMTPIITSPSIASGNTGMPFAYTITAINSPTSFGASGLPAGLSVDITSGLISGVPGVAGSFTVELFATNVAGVGNLNLSLQISNLPVVLSSLSVTGQVSVPFIYNLAVANPPALYGASGLPAGLNLDPNADTISGIPQANGIFTVPVTATNGAGSAGANLLIDIRPINDDFTNAIDFGAVFQVVGSNAGATRELGEPSFISSAASGSVWWKWTAPASGAISVNTIGSPFDTILGVFTNLPGANAVTNLATVGTDDDSGGNGDSLVAFSAVSGVTYYFCVSGFHSSSQGSIVLTIDALPRITSVGSVTNLAGFPFSYQITAANNPTGFGVAGLPGGLACDPLTGLISGAAPASGSYLVTLSATNAFGTASAPLTLASVPLPLPVITSPNSPVGQVGQPFNYTLTAANYPLGFNAFNLPNGLSINGASGAITGLPAANGNYLVTLVVSNISGTISNGFVFDIRPVNDDFASAIPLPIAGVVHGSTVGATAEAGEPKHAGSIAQHSIWYSWSTPTNCALEVSTFGSPFDTVLAVYTGNSVTNLSLIVSNDDTGSSTNSLVIFNATANTAYYVAVDGYGGAEGAVTLNLVSIPTVDRINTAPILARILNQTVDPGTVLSLPIVATDADLPAQTLTYSFPYGTPTGAAINPTTGLFSWQPTAGQAGTTNLLTVAVTDNGIPPLSDTRQFQVVVNPLAPIVLTPVAWYPAGSGREIAAFVFQFTGNTGLVYSVQYATNLAPAVWLTVKNLQTTNSPTWVTNAHANPPQGFYRIQTGP